MADFNQINQFGSVNPIRSGEGMSCAECEAMLADWMDAAGDGTQGTLRGALSPRDRAAFDLHIASCKECGQMLADAQRGAALLEMLRFPRPEPSAALFERILAQTAGLSTDVEASATSAAGVLGLNTAGPSLAAVPAANFAPAAGSAAALEALPSNVLPFRNAAAFRFNLSSITRTMMQPRFAMTAAMAFFSIALTMNLTGVHLSELKASDLKPSSIRRTFYQADASIVRYYDNLRVVYELESRVSDLKQASESDNPTPGGKTGSKGGSRDDSSPASKEKSSPDGGQKRAQPKSGSGTSQRRSPLNQDFRLADEQFDRPLDRNLAVAALDRTVLSGTRKIKSNEMLQEGVSV